MKPIQPVDLIEIANTRFRGHDLQPVLLDISAGNIGDVTFSQAERFDRLGYIVTTNGIVYADGLVSPADVMQSEQYPVVSWFSVLNDGSCMLTSIDEFCKAYAAYYGLTIHDDGKVYTPDYHKPTQQEFKSKVREHLQIIGLTDTKIRAEIVRTIPSFATVMKRPEIKAESFAEVEDERPDFLIQPYFPVGKLTIVQADPGTGKTTMMCGVAALASIGASLCGVPCKPVNSLFFSTEDDASDLRGRIEQSGGDLSRCKFVSAENCAGLSLVSPIIEKLIQETQAGLVVFDPLQQFLGGIDMFRANETRPILSALAAMAKRNHCAVVLISHMAKAQGKGLYKALGSIDIVGAARSVLYVVRDPEKDEAEQENIVMHIKSSAAKAGQAIRYQIADSNGHASVKWLARVPYTERDYQKAVARMDSQKEGHDQYDTNDLVMVVRQLVTDNPNGLFISYDELDKCCVEILGRYVSEGYNAAFKKIRGEMLTRDRIRIDFLDQGKRMSNYCLRGKEVETDHKKKARGVIIAQLQPQNEFQTSFNAGE